MSYVTLPEIKSYLTISSETHDANLSLLITYACAVVESYIGQELVSNSYTEYHDGGKSSIFVNRTPINNVNQVAEYDGIQYAPLVGPNSDGSFINTAANANVVQYTWYADTGKITRDVGESSGHPLLSLTAPRSFRNFPKGVKITYNGGYDNIPDDIKLATLDYVKILYKQDFATSMSFQGDIKSNAPLTANFPPHIRRLLDMHRVIR